MAALSVKTSFENETARGRKVTRQRVILAQNLFSEDRHNNNNFISTVNRQLKEFTRNIIINKRYT